MPSKPLFLAVVLSCLAVLLLVVPGLPPGHSVAFNYGWSVQYSDALSWTNPLPRYLPGLWAGFGGQDFFFYAPLPFWLVGALAGPLCPGCAPSTEFVLGASVFLAASGFSMFAFLRCFVAARPAVFGAVVYCLLPYHLLIDWFERQAAGEFTAYAFIPLIALGIERLRRQTAGGWILSLGVAGTALSHLPTTLLAGHVFAVLVLVFVAGVPGGAAARLGLLAQSVGFGLLGLALAAFYWVPAIALMDSVSPGTLFDPYFEAWRWLYGRTEAQPNPRFAFRVLVSFLACVPLLLGAVRSARGPLLAWILVPAAVALVMNSAPSEPIWRGWIISKVQFPWRLMTLADFATGIAAAVLMAKAINRTDRLFLAVTLAVLVAMTAFLAATVRLSPQGKPPEQMYRNWFAAVEYLSPEMSGTLSHRLGKSAIGHFDQHRIADTLAAMADEVAAGQGTGQVLDRRPRSLAVQAPPGATVLSLPVQYWAPWRAWTADGTALAIRANPRFGTLDILAPAGGFGEAPVTVSLPLQPSEWAGAAISLLAMLVLSAVLLRRRLARS